MSSSIFLDKYMDLIRSMNWISVPHLKFIREDDSLIDRLSYRYTVAICILFAVIVTAKQYAGDPIDCWVPAQFKASYEKYADSYCWITGSWYMPVDKELPLSEHDRKQYKIRYYQWVPFLLLFQATLCYIPRVIWRCFRNRSGLDLTNLLDAAAKYDNVDNFSDREKIMRYIIKKIERFINSNYYSNELINDYSAFKVNFSLLHQRLQIAKNELKDSQIRIINKQTSKVVQILHMIKIGLRSFCFCLGKSYGNYLLIVYVVVKTFWLTNAISQLFLLNHFIGNDYHAFGIEIVKLLLTGQEWNELKYFPRVTYCDFKIREIGNSHDWTVQCILRINLFNEVIYIFMWFWLCLLAFCCIIDYACLISFLLPRRRLDFIKSHLNLSINGFHSFSSLENENNDVFHEKSSHIMLSNGLECLDIINKHISIFTFSYLKIDCIFALRILATNCSDLLVTEIIGKLWDKFITWERSKELHELIKYSESWNLSTPNGYGFVSSQKDKFENVHTKINLESQSSKKFISNEVKNITTNKKTDNYEH